MNRLSRSMLGMALMAVPVLTAQANGHQSSLPEPERTYRSNAASSNWPSTPRLPDQQESSVTQETVPAEIEQQVSNEEITREVQQVIASGSAQLEGSVGNGSVARSAFTTAIENREPINELSKLNNENQRIYFFTDLRDMAGQTARHRWEYNDEVISEVAFNVKGPRWRVWSGKTFKPAWAGEWRVSVLNGANEVISERVLEFDPDVVDAEIPVPQYSIPPQ